MKNVVSSWGGGGVVRLSRMAFVIRWEQKNCTGFDVMRNYGVPDRQPQSYIFCFHFEYENSWDFLNIRYGENSIALLSGSTGWVCGVGLMPVPKWGLRELSRG